MMNKQKKGRGERPNGLPTIVICDFDGTVSKRDIGHEVLKHFSGSRWVEIDRAYCSGKIGSLDAYSLIASFIKIRQDALESFLSGFEGVDPSFPGFYRFCREQGMDLKIVSDGLDYYIRNILRRENLADIEFYANGLEFGEGGSIRITFPFSNPECGKCGTCKSGILSALKHSYGRILYVGDGHSDVCPANLADLVFGKEILYRKCLSNGKSCIKYSDFGQVREYLVNDAYDYCSPRKDCSAFYK